MSSSSKRAADLAKCQDMFKQTGMAESVLTEIYDRENGDMDKVTNKLVELAYADGPQAMPATATTTSTASTASTPAPPATPATTATYAQIAAKPSNVAPHATPTSSSAATTKPTVVAAEPAAAAAAATAAPSAPLSSDAAKSVADEKYRQQLEELEYWRKLKEQQDRERKRADESRRRREETARRQQEAARQAAERAARELEEAQRLERSMMRTAAEQAEAERRHAEEARAAAEQRAREQADADRELAARLDAEERERTRVQTFVQDEIASQIQRLLSQVSSAPGPAADVAAVAAATNTSTESPSATTSSSSTTSEPTATTTAATTTTTTAAAAAAAAAAAPTPASAAPTAPTMSPVCIYTPNMVAGEGETEEQLNDRKEKLRTQILDIKAFLLGHYAVSLRDMREMSMTHDLEVMALIREQLGGALKTPTVVVHGVAVGNFADVRAKHEAGELRTLLAAPDADVVRQRQEALQLGVLDTMLNVTEILGSGVKSLVMLPVTLPYYMVSSMFGWGTPAAADSADVDIDVLMSNWYWRSLNRTYRFTKDQVQRLHPRHRDVRACHAYEAIERIDVNPDGKNMVMHFTDGSSPEYLCAAPADVQRMIELISNRRSSPPAVNKLAATSAAAV